MSGKPWWRRYLVDASWFGLGLVVAILLVLTCHDLAYGAGIRGMWASTFAQARASATQSQALSGDESLRWLRSAGWIVLSVLTFLVGAIVLARHFIFGRRISRPALGIIGAYSYAFLLMVYFTIHETQLLRYDYYASILIPLEFLVLGIVVFPCCSNLTKPALWWTVAAAVCISLAPFWRVSFYTPGAEKNVAWHYVVGLAALTLAIVRPRPSATVAAIVGLAVSGFGLVALFKSGWVLESNGSAATRRVADAVRTINYRLGPGQYSGLLDR